MLKSEIAMNYFSLENKGKISSIRPLLGGLERGRQRMLTELQSAKKVTGAKQVTRALKNGTAHRVFLAEDADPRVTEPIALLCQEQEVPTEPVATMSALGAACGITVGSAVAAIVV